MPLRAGGMVLTLNVIAIAAAVCIWLSASSALRF